MIKAFLHTGFEVASLDTAIKDYEKLGYKLLKKFDKPEPKAAAVHMSVPNGVDIELWQFFDKEHPQVKYIARHIALESDDLEADVEDLTKNDFELVIPITKGVVLTYAFLSDADGNYIEVAAK